MDFINDIKNNTIIVCDYKSKEQILEYLDSNNLMLNIKFMTIFELIRKYYFDYDEQTIYYLMSKYHFKYDFSEMLIENMYYIDDMNYSNDKLNKLVIYKKELIDNHLLYEDLFFKNSIINYNFVIFNYNLNKFQKRLIEKINKVTDVKVIDRNYKYNKHKVYGFKSIEQEVNYVAYKICELINRGVDINRIKLCNISDDYHNYIRRIFGFYNIPINLDIKNSIYGTKIVQEFLDNYRSDIKETINLIRKYENMNIYNSIIDICNKYVWCSDYELVKDMIVYDLKNTFINYPKLSKAVEIIDYKNCCSDDEYVFLLNFNIGFIPKIYKDEDFIEDSLKRNLDLEDSLEKNLKEKDITIKSINDISNLILTYKLRTPGGEFYPSNLIDLFELEEPFIDETISYSDLYNKLNLSIDLDKLIKYGIRSKKIDILFNNYSISYLTYCNRFSGIDKNDYLKYIGKKLSLSYTTLNSYNECSFRYYLDNILKLNIYEDNFSTVLGNIYHYILEHGVKEEINVSSTVDNYISKKYSDRCFSKTELFFINKIKSDMDYVLTTIRNQMKLSKLSNIMTEQKVNVEMGHDVKVTFTGKIDKLLFNNFDGKTIIAIIDYKTGNSVDIELNYLSYGLYMQLPIYLFLASNMNFDNPVFAGIYLQKVLPTINKIDHCKSIEEIKKNNLKLQGFSIKNQDVLEKFDCTFRSSEIISSMRTKNDGDFYNYCKVLSDDDIKKIIGITRDQIEKGILNIENAEFNINPKQEELDKDITACKYCKYRDICFRSNDDVVKIKSDKDLSYLGGEKDA